MKAFLTLAVSAVVVNCYAQNAINQFNKDGQKEGYWEGRYDDGTIKYQGTFKKGIPVGSLKRYYQNGNLLAIMNFDPESDTCFVEIYYNHGKIQAQGAYLNEEKAGSWKYFSAFSETITNIEHYQKGLVQGTAKHFYPSGEVFEELTWEQGKKHGVWKQYFKSGDVKVRGNYTNHQLDGVFKTYYPNGKVEIEGNYTDNMMNGKWIYYTEEGKVKLELLYQKGKVQNVEDYDEQQKEMFKLMEQNIGKIAEPSEEDFLMNRR